MMLKMWILVILLFCKHKLCNLNLESQNQKRQNVVRENMFLKPKYKVNRKFHNMKNCLFFPLIWIRIHLEAKVQNPGAMYWNFITRAPMTLFIVRQRMFSEKSYSY